MHDIVCVGSATEDVFVSVEAMKTISVADRHDEQCYIAFEHGGKIPVENIFIATGGGATNTAVGFARLGLKTGIVSMVGTDAAAERILAKLRRERVDLDGVARTPDHATGYSVILTCFTGDRTVLVYRGACAELSECDVNWEMLSSSRWLYQASMSGKSASLFGRVCLFCREHGVKVAINPGGTQLAAGLDGLQEALEACDVVYVNKTEAYRLAGVEPRQGHADEMLVLEKLHAAGCETVVMTDGSRGAEAFDGATHYTVPAVEVKVASTLGAGDAFASGCTSALVKGANLREALRAGSVNAANVCRYLGGKRGLLRADQLQKALENLRPS
ncbi:MAG TPA: hypothetical protein DGT21_00495 [Armatimonadetes bacterium]|jgi:ribokinase|nr:hypothetical protein [Armatimonadota bacterium]